MAPRPLSQGCRVDGSVHRQAQAGDPGRAPRRSGYRADPAEPLSCTPCDQSEVERDRVPRPSVHALTRVPGGGFGTRLTVLPVDFAGVRVRDVLGRTPRATRPAAERPV